MNSDVMTDVILVRKSVCKATMQWSGECFFTIFKVSRLVRVYIDSHRNGHNETIFAVSFEW